MLSVLPSLAHNNLDDLAVLSKVVLAAQSIEEAIFAYRGRETCHVDEVLLDDAEPGEMLAAEGVGFSLLCLLLSNLRVLLGLLCDLLLVSSHPV